MITVDSLGDLQQAIWRLPVEEPPKQRHPPPAPPAEVAVAVAYSTGSDRISSDRGQSRFEKSRRRRNEIINFFLLEFLKLRFDFDCLLACLLCAG